MGHNYYHDISRDFFIENLRSLRAVSESNVYKSLGWDPLDMDSVFTYSVNASKHGHELGFTTDYITNCIRFAFESGIQAAVAWADENITMNPNILAIWKEVI